MRQGIKWLILGALLALLVLFAVPLTAKDVSAATYPTKDQITMEGKTLNENMPSGVSYDETTGVLTLDSYKCDNGKMTVSGKTDLTIRLNGTSHIWGKGVTIEAGLCNLTIDGHGTIDIRGTMTDYSGDPSIVGPILAYNLTLKDNVSLSLAAMNTVTGKNASCVAIRATKDVIITDDAWFSYNGQCGQEHTGGKADYGIWTGGNIIISTNRPLYFNFMHYGFREDRYALAAGGDITVTNCPMIQTSQESDLTNRGKDWAPQHYVYSSETKQYGDPAHAFVPAPRNYVSVSGDNRWITAIEIAKRAFVYGPEGEVILVYGMDFPDALAASSYAGISGAPILLSDRKKLADPVKELFDGEWKGKISQITVIGGGFEPQFYQDLNELGFSKENGKLAEIAGNNRFETAELVTDAVYKKAAAKSIDITAVAVTTGLNFADALSFSPWAYRNHIPILLVKKDGTVTEETRTLIANAKYVFMLGGENVCPTANLSETQQTYHIYQRLQGENRYQTSQAIADYFVTMTGSGSFEGMAFADGTKAHFPDALAGAMLQGQLGAPIVLTQEGQPGLDYVKPYVEKNLTGVKTAGYTFYFLGWSAKGKSSEYSDLVGWIEKTS